MTGSGGKGPARAGRVFLGAACAASAAALLVDAVAARDLIRVDAATLWWLGAGSLLCGAAAGLVLVVLVVPASRIAHGRAGALPRRLGELVVAVPLPLLGLRWVLDDLLSGPAISRHEWIDTFRVAAGAFSIMVPMLVVFFLPKLVAARRRTAIVVLAGIAVAAAIADAEVLPRLYPAFHLALTVIVLTCAGGVGVLLLGSGPRSLRAPSLAWAGAGAAALGAVALGWVPAGDGPGREMLLVRTRFTARLVGPIAPAPALDAEVSAEALEAFAAPAPVDATELDARLPERRRFNIVMITLDAVRADHVGHLGYRRDTTPVLDALARESVVFENTWCQHPSSPLSMASLFRGRYPTGTDVWRQKQEGSRDPSALTDPTLGRALRDAGWTTRAVASIPRGFMESQIWFVESEFESFENHTFSKGVSAERISERAEVVLRELDDSKPFFLWLHVFNPHAPYVHHPEHDFGSDEIDLYDSEIAYADAHIGRMLALLRARPDWDRTVLVVNSDHGEEFSDHGGLGHHSGLYEEQVRVPMMMRVPGLAPRQVGRVAGIVDVMPTLLELVGLPVDEGLHGRSLVRTLLGEDLPGDGVAFSQFRERRFLTGRLDAVRVGPMKLIHNVRAGTFELFDLSRDPRELDNLAHRRPEERRRLEGYLAAARRLTAGDLHAEPDDPDRRLAARAREGPTSERMAALDTLLERGRQDLALPVLRDMARADRPVDLCVAAVERLALHAREHRDALVTLAGHANGDVRAATAWPLAAARAPDATAALVRLARDDETTVSARGAIGLGLNGSDAAIARLRRAAAEAVGEDRILAEAALARLDVSRAPALAALAAWSDTRPVIDYNVVAAAASRPDVHTLPALYFRNLFPLPFGESTAVMLEQLADAPLDCALPFLRIHLVSLDLAMRKRAVDVLRRHDAMHLLRPLHEAEERMHLARRRALEPKRRLEAFALITETWNELMRHGVADWGALVEMIQTGLAADDRAGLGKRLPALARPALDGASPVVRGILERQIAVVGRLFRKPAGVITLDRVDPLPVSEGDPWCVGVKLAVSAEGGSLPGGLVQLTPSFTARLERGDEVIDLLPGNLPVPAGGLLAGETVRLILPFRPPPLAPGAWRLEIGFGYRQHRMAPRVLHDIRVPVR